MVITYYPLLSAEYANSTSFQLTLIGYWNKIHGIQSFIFGPYISDLYCPFFNAYLYYSKRKHIANSLSLFVHLYMLIYVFLTSYSMFLPHIYLCFTVKICTHVQLTISCILFELIEPHIYSSGGSSHLGLICSICDPALLHPEECVILGGMRILKKCLHV